MWVNDRLVGEDSIANMGWPFGDLVAYASRNSKVVAGDVLGSGTVGNGGCLAELWGRRGSIDPPALVEGDVVRMWIENIGEIANVVGAPVSGPGHPLCSSPESNRPCEPLSTPVGTGPWIEPRAAALVARG